MKLKSLSLSLLIVFMLGVAASANARPLTLGRWAIVRVDPGQYNYTEVYADVCWNRYAPPTQIAQGLWRLSNPFEQTIQFVCERW